jgi:hypothetical protein
MLLPSAINNNYQGSRVAVWLLWLIAAMKIVMGLNSTINARLIAQTADGIPLTSYPGAAAQTVVSLFALVSFVNLLVGLLCVLVLVRYRAAIPLAFLLLLLEHGGKRLILLANPIERIGGGSGTAINLTLLLVMALGLFLSLRRSRVAA